MRQNKIIAIVGPTGIGKTALSVALAKRFNGEVVNGDAYQIYKRLNVGTAKPTIKEQQDVPHHLFDILEPTQSFSVFKFQKMAREKFEEIWAKCKTPIFVGGSGQYVEAVLFDYVFKEENRNPNFANQYDNLNNKQLHDKLTELDSDSAKNIHPNNRKRVLRALEIAQSGEKKSELLAKQSHKLMYDTYFVGLELNREELYSRINLRVDKMLDLGLEQEVKNLFDEGFETLQSMQAIGYKEWAPYFHNETSKEEVVELIKRNTRRFAKRQLTYFRNRMDVNWFEVNINDFKKTISVVFDTILLET